jgi:glyoxylase-like metal-dependent hydrolase (beta-lactamase superfamily II)
MKIHSFNISNCKIDGGAMFGVIPKSLWSRKYPADENNLCTFALRSLVIEHEGRVVLIDTGYGDKQSEKFYKHTYMHDGVGLMNGLKQAGYSPEDITDVIITHLHADHAGGAVKRNENNELVPSFPNAKYWISQKMWDWALEGNIREAASFIQENFIPLKEHNVLELIQEEKEIIPGIEVKIVSGHTRGQVIPIIRHPKATIAYMADLIPCTGHIPLLYNMAYEIEPLLTIKEKQELLENAVKENYILFLQHDAYTECVSVQDSPKGIIEKERLELNKILQ